MADGPSNSSGEKGENKQPSLHEQIQPLVDENYQCIDRCLKKACDPGAQKRFDDAVKSAESRGLTKVVEDDQMKYLFFKEV